MNETNNGENNNQNFEQQNMNQNNAVESAQEQYIQPKEQVNEQPKKENNKNYCGLLIVFMVISLLLAGFIVYDKCLKKEKIKEPEKQEEVSKPEETSKEKELELIDNYRIISKRVEAYQDDFYLVKKSTPGSDYDYEVVKYLGRTFKDFEYYFGFYNSRIYYSDLENIKYIDLTDKNLAEKIWIKVPKEETIAGLETAFELGAQIVGDSLYIRHYESNNLGYLSLNAKSFDEYKEIVRENNSIEDWIVVGEEDIYYAAFDYEVEHTSVLYHYNTKSKETKKVMVLGSNHDFFYVNGNIVYCKETNEKKSAHEYVHNLFAYNPSTTSTLKISDIIFDAYDKTCGDYFTARGDNVYYYDDHGTIFKYNMIDGTSSEYYKLVVKTDRPQGMYFVDDDNMMFYYYPSKVEYASNGEKVESLPNKKVLMLDNTVKYFGINVFGSIKDTRF